MKKNNSSTSSSEQRPKSKNSSVKKLKKATSIKKSKKVKEKTKKTTKAKVSKKNKSPTKPQTKKSQKKSSKTKDSKDKKKDISVAHLNELNHEFPNDAPEIIPEGYGDHRLVFIARDPQWAFCFWEIDQTKLENFLRERGKPNKANLWKIRVYCHSVGNDEKGETFLDFDIDLVSGKLHLELFPPGSTFTAKLGLMDEQNNFTGVLTSNSIDLPSDRPSENDEEIWSKGENIQEVFLPLATREVENPKLSVESRSRQSFGVSSASRYKASKK
jgi:hypothetical protein